MGDGATSYLKLDTTTDSISFITGVGGNSASCLVGSNKIISSKYVATYSVFDIDTEITTSYALAGGNMWGATLGIDGRVYFSSYGGTSQYAALTKQTINKNLPLSRYNNKY